MKCDVALRVRNCGASELFELRAKFLEKFPAVDSFELERINGWKLLEELGAQLEQLTRAAISNAERDITFHRIGSMFCLFFARAPIGDLAGAKLSDLRIFAKFFHLCLDR